MKIISIIILNFISTLTYGQACNCELDSNFREIISCDSIVFNNNSMLYRQFNCDSSWLTFENQSGMKRIIYILKNPMVDLTEKLGFQFEREYKSAFLIEDITASGCCDVPVEYILFDKISGEQIINFGIDNYLFKDSIDDFIVFFKDKKLNAITIYNLNNKKEIEIKLPLDKKNTTLYRSEIEYWTDSILAEELYKPPIINYNICIIRYRYQKKGLKNKWFTNQVKLDITNIR